MEGRQWSPPELASPTLSELCQKLKHGDPPETPVGGLVPIEVPLIEESPLVEVVQASAEEPPTV